MVATAEEMLMENDDDRQQDRRAEGSTIVLQMNKAPTLKGMDRKAMTTFMAELKAYRNHFRDDPNAKGQIQRSLRSMIDPGLLRAVCTWELGKDAEKVTERDLTDWIKRHLMQDRPTDANIDREMRKLAMKLSITTPAARVVYLIQPVW
ncbi:Uncharacterized protein PBTT_07451 [Plasmodiophora brassicae]